MGALAGLPGTNGKPRDVEFFHSISRGMILLGRDKVATTSGNEGAINIWTDDEGKYRGCRMRYMQNMSDIISPTKSKLKQWLIDELPKIKA